MFDQLFEKIQRVDEVESNLLSLLEGKTWEQIALSLYQILDDISTADDMCKENANAFRNMVMKLQAKKNQLLFSPDGYKVKRVDEFKVGDIVQLTHRKETGYRIPGFAKGTVNQALPDNRFLVNFEWSISGKSVKQLANLDVSDIENVEESKLKEGTVDHAQRELKLAGLFDKDSDYNGMIGEAVLELMEVFSKQGHSGMSAALVRELFAKLSNFEPLTELTDNSDEWNDISEMQAGKLGWQSQRSPSCFSEDNGKTYWDINEDYFFYTDENGTRWSGGLSKEDWDKRPIHTSKHVGKEE